MEHKLPPKILDKKMYMDRIRKEVGKIYEANRARCSFVNLCLKYRLSYSQIGELMGVGKMTIYNLHRYGTNGAVKPRERGLILERENNRCLICRKGGKLEIHHIGNPKNKKKSNLVALCPKCHRRQDAVKRRAVQAREAKRGADSRKSPDNLK